MEPSGESNLGSGFPFAAVCFVSSTSSDLLPALRRHNVKGITVRDRLGGGSRKFCNRLDVRGRLLAHVLGSVEEVLVLRARVRCFGDTHRRMSDEHFARAGDVGSFIRLQTLGAQFDANLDLLLLHGDYWYHFRGQVLDGRLTANAVRRRSLEEGARSNHLDAVHWLRCILKIQKFYVRFWSWWIEWKTKYFKWKTNDALTKKIDPHLLHAT